MFWQPWPSGLVWQQAPWLFLTYFLNEEIIMQTITLGKTRYIISDARADILAAHAACTGKHKRVKSKGADLRRFPAYWDGMSTADYVARYYEINSNRREFPSGKGAPYATVTLEGFYEGLNTAPAAQYTSADSFEVQA